MRSLTIASVRRWLSQPGVSLPILTVVGLVIAGCNLESEDSSSRPVPPPSADVIVEKPIVATTPPPARSTPPVARLGVGDPAPKLQLDQFVLGSPLNESLEGKVHVVEFWATWCGPCRRSMPHISELQQYHRDEVTFIGVTREDTATVSEFLEDESPDGQLWRDVVHYRLAIDADNATNNAYMRAAGQRGIPTAFIVGGDGIIKWIGHPSRIDEPLQQVVDGLL